MNTLHKNMPNSIKKNIFLRLQLNQIANNFRKIKNYYLNALQP